MSRLPYDGRFVTTEEWTEIGRRLHEVPVWLPDCAPALGKIPNLSTIILLRPGETGRSDDSAASVWGPRIAARSERYLLTGPELRHLPKKERAALVAAAFHECSAAALGEISRQSRSMATMLGMSSGRSRAGRGRADHIQATNDAKLWDPLPDVLRDMLLERYRIDHPRGPSDPSEVHNMITAVLRSTPGPSIGAVPRGLTPHHARGAPHAALFGKKSLARELGIGEWKVQAALGDLTGFWALHRWLEIELFEEASSYRSVASIARGIELFQKLSEATVHGREVVSTADTSDELLAQRFEQIVKKLWKARVVRPIDHYLELVRSVPETRSYADAAEKFLRSPMLWEWLGARYRARALERYPEHRGSGELESSVLSF